MSNLKCILLTITSVIFGLLSYPFLEISLNIINHDNQLVGLVAGFIIVPMSILIFLSALICAFTLFVYGLANGYRLWWILAIFIIILCIGAVVFAILV